MFLALVHSCMYLALEKIAFDLCSDVDLDPVTVMW